ncbi:hypothetical protein [Roseomonas sp. 18066]|uniref:hypothetical protein n=1 Tax=Roseomonas sp. 18066 TaxID=2681412 RepID=UPI001357E492|nr:hypothetical protein [Roseomonas sp. 18066]
MSDLVTVNHHDPVSGELRYSYVTSADPDRSGQVYSRTAYDLDDTHSWQSYTINTGYFGLEQARTTSIVAVLDDGSTMKTDYSYFGALASYPIQYLETWTRSDAEGNVRLVVENWDSPIDRFGGENEYYNRVMKYEAGSADPYYVHTRYYDGPRESITYDRENGNKDYVLNTWLDGRLKAEDYNPDTGLLDYVITRDDTGYRLVEDYDAQGRLDYVIETLADGKTIARDHDPASGLLDYVIETAADGRRVATDYDLADEYSWESFTITYNAAGQIESAVLI